MSDNRSQYHTIQKTLKQLYPFEPEGNLACLPCLPSAQAGGRQARQLNTLAALISGIVSSKRTNLPAVASKVPDGAKAESRACLPCLPSAQAGGRQVKRFARWIANHRIEAERIKDSCGAQPPHNPELN